MGAMCLLQIRAHVQSHLDLLILLNMWKQVVPLKYRYWSPSRSPITNNQSAYKTNVSLNSSNWPGSITVAIYSQGWLSCNRQWVFLELSCSRCIHSWSTVVPAASCHRQSSWAAAVKQWQKQLSRHQQQGWLLVVVWVIAPLINHIGRFLSPTPLLTGKQTQIQAYCPIKPSTSLASYR